MLFTLSRSPAQCDLPTLLRQASPGDALLLLQDGVLAALAGAHLDLLLAAPISLYVLRNDLEARGLSGHISHKVTVIDYNHFVELTTTHRSQMAW